MPQLSSFCSPETIVVTAMYNLRLLAALFAQTNIEIIVSCLLREILLKLCPSTSVCLRWSLCIRHAGGIVRALGKRKSAHRPPSVAFPSFPISAVHTGGLYWSQSQSHNIFHTALSAIQQHFPLSFACSIYLHEGNEQWPTTYKTLSLHLACDVSYTFSMFTLFLLQSYKNRIILSEQQNSQAFIRALLQQAEGTAAAAIDFESRRSWWWVVTKVWSSCTWQAVQAVNHPHPAASPVTNVSPLSEWGSAHLRQSHNFTVWHSRMSHSFSASRSTEKYFISGECVSKM